MTWDAIIIGSGIGGMATAALLARVGGLRVLVLEKHYERGGQTHVFRRDGASWDVGVHYVGDVAKGSVVRSLFDFMSGGALDWIPMCDDFERFVYPDGLEFRVPSNKKAYQERLIARFPEEEKGIRRYFEDIKRVTDWYTVSILQGSSPWPMSSLMSMLRTRSKSKALQTTAQYLDAQFKSPELKSLLASQWMDYGVPPKESAFALHALVVYSYMGGGWFPKGGSSRIARTFEATVEAHGGAVKVCHEVTSILTDEKDRAIGVKAIDHTGEKPKEIVFNAPIVVSNAGAELTYTRLLPVSGSIGRRTEPVRAVVDKLKGGVSSVTLYLRLRQSASTIGIKGENIWINTTLEHGDDLEAQTAAAMAGKPQQAFVSFPSLKSGDDDRFHTAEIIAMISGDRFKAWQNTKHGNRGQDYLDQKECITHGLLDLAETAVPGLKNLVCYAELATPLTVEDYTSRVSGSFYGLRGTPDRYKSSGHLSSISPVPGLFISGSDVWSLGVAGALMGGVLAAGSVLGPLGFLRVMKAARSGIAPYEPLAPGTNSNVSGKRRVRVMSKVKLTPLISLVEFELDEPIESFTPGQYAMLCVAPFEWRSYSVASVDKNRMTLLINVGTGGDGSLFIEGCEVGAETQVELPFGDFRVQPNDHRKVFIATGTGLAPFLPMFANLEDQSGLDSAELLFGARLVKDSILNDMETPLPKRTTLCASRDPESKSDNVNVFHGRVTEALKGLEFEAATTDFYVCGAPAMVTDCRAILTRAGAQNVFIESY